jgi:peptide/nickel transport system substrate-binding protein
MLFNNTRAPFTDVRVRRAIAMAVDRKEVIDKAVSGAGVLSGPMPTGHGDWPIPAAELPYRVDLEGARRLLAEAGFPRGFKTTLQTTPQYPEFVSAAVVLQAQLKRIGVEAELQSLEWGQVLKNINRQSRNYDLCMVAYTFFPDPDNYLFNFYHSTAGNNFCGFNRPEYDRRVEEARATLDRGRRRALYLDIQKYLLDEAPSVYLYVGESLEGLAAGLRGYTPSYTGRRMFFKKSWLAA